MSDAPEPSETDPPRQQIPGYRIVDRIGSGANGIVYKARQLSLDRWVAIKVLPTRLSEDPQFVERFHAEGRAAGRLNHGNIVQPIDVGEAEGHHYYVMEYVEGETVFEGLEELVRYDEEEAVRIALDVARALEHAHAAGMVHRDVKPQNIMLTGEGKAKLADMGLALAVTDTDLIESEKGKAIGSPYYIAPEQIRGRGDVDFRADLYGLGATLYTMVTGDPPFDAETAREVMQKHLLAPLKPPRKLNPTLSEELDQVIRVLMARDRDQRYDQTADLVADLEALTMGEPPLKAQVKLGEGIGAPGEGEEGIEGEATAPGGETATGDAEAGAEAVTDAEDPPAPYRRSHGPALSRQPLFWAAIAGWSLALLFFLLWAGSG